MPTFGAWADTVLDLTWEIADHLSLHTYYDPDGFRDVDAFLACSRDLGYSTWPGGGPAFCCRPP